MGAPEFSLAVAGVVENSSNVPRFFSREAFPLLYNRDGRRAARMKTARPFLRRRVPGTLAGTVENSQSEMFYGCAVAFCRRREMISGGRNNEESNERARAERAWQRGYIGSH